MNDNRIIKKIKLNNENDENNNLERLFFLVFRFKVIRDKIFSFLDSISSPSYESLCDVDSIINNYGIGIVIDKVKSNKYLIFNQSIVKSNQIEYHFKDIFHLVKKDKQFYYKLFKNYTIKEFLSVESLFKMSISQNNILALQIIIELYKVDLKKIKPHIENNQCSVKLLKYLVEDLDVSPEIDLNLNFKFNPKYFKTINYILLNKISLFNNQNILDKDILKYIFDINLLKMKFKYLIEACKSIEILSKEISPPDFNQLLNSESFDLNLSVVKLIIQHYENEIIKKEIIKVIKYYISYTNFHSRELYLLLNQDEFKYDNISDFNILKYGDFLKFNFNFKHPIKCLFKYCPSEERQILFLENSCSKIKMVKTIDFNTVFDFILSLIKYDNLSYIKIVFILLGEELIKISFNSSPISVASAIKSIKVLEYLIETAPQIFINKINWSNFENVNLLKHYQKLVKSNNIKNNKENLDDIYFTNDQELSKTANYILNLNTNIDFQNQITNQIEFDKFIETLANIKKPFFIYPFNYSFEKIFSQHYFRKFIVWVVKTQKYQISNDSFHTVNSLIQSSEISNQCGIIFKWMKNGQIRAFYFSKQFNEISTNSENIELLFKDEIISYDLPNTFCTEFVDSILSSNLVIKHEYFHDFFNKNILHLSINHDFLNVIKLLDKKYKSILKNSLNALAINSRKQILKRCISKDQIEITRILSGYISKLTKQEMISLKNHIGHNSIFLILKDLINK